MRAARLFAVALALLVGVVVPSGPVAYADPIYDMVLPVVGTYYYTDTFGAPRGGGTRTHEGIDIMSPKLTPVVAVASGTVNWVSSNCCAMSLDHDDGWSSWYIHLNNDTPGTDDGFAPAVVSGAHVEQGQLIGWVGDSGNAEHTGSHLHFELHDPDGIVINPYESLLVAPTVSPTTFATAPLGCDFNDDGYHDVANGVPGSGVNGSDSGAVLITHGSSGGPDGQPYLLSSGLAGGRMGESIACGDFNDDNYDDLAVGLPAADGDSGAIILFEGSTSGLSASGEYLDAASPSFPGAKETGDRLGASLASGDFDDDGYDDLAIGVPGEDVSGSVDTGGVVILEGSASGLDPAGNAFSQKTPGVAGAGETDDQYGISLTALDSDDDGYDDLVVGVPFEDIGSRVDAGTVQIFYGGSTGIAFTGEEFWNQASSGIRGAAEAGDLFGWSLTSSDVDQDGYEDLFIGSPREDVGSLVDAGYVQLIRGGSGGLTGSADRGWHQDSSGVTGVAEANDAFGSSISAADFNGDGFIDVAVGAPGEAIGSLDEAGSVTFLFGGFFYYYDARFSESVTQAFAGVPGSTESGDQFGTYIVAGDFDDNGTSDFAVGAPGEDISGNSDSGYVVLMSLSEWIWSAPTHLGQIDALALEPQTQMGVVDR